MFEMIGGIILEGLKTFNEERRTRFMDKYHDIITRLKDAENDTTSEYTDAAIDIPEEEKLNFLMAYKSELQGHNNENN